MFWAKNFLGGHTFYPGHSVSPEANFRTFQAEWNGIDNYDQNKELDYQEMDTKCKHPRPNLSLSFFLF